MIRRRVLVCTKNNLLVSHCFDLSDTVIYTKFVHSVFGIHSTIKTDTNLSCTIAHIPFLLVAVKFSRYLSKSIAVYFCAKFRVGFGQLVCIQSSIYQTQSPDNVACSTLAHPTFSYVVY